VAPLPERPRDLPTAAELLAGARQFQVPLRVRFRGTDVREGLLLRGPEGWGEFAPFPEYGPREAARWLAAAVEAAWQGWPAPERASVPVNVIVPAVAPDVAARLVRESGCTTAKVKVAEPGQPLDADVARVAAVREALGSDGRLRLDANGAWSPVDAVHALAELGRFGLEYVEQPCTSVEDCADVRRRVDVPVAVDEGLRKAPDPLDVARLREAADVLVLKVPPLGGVRAARAVAGRHGLPCVVSSALDTSVGLAAGVALAAALPQLPYACGLGSGLLLGRDVTDDRVVPQQGAVRVRTSAPEPDAGRCGPVSPAWGARLAAAEACLREAIP
jgi:O-succinylbenzoate synthase